MNIKLFLSVLLIFSSSSLIKAQGYDEDVTRLSTRERIYLGGGLTGLSFGSAGGGNTSFSIGLGPQIGYLLTNSSVIGLGVNYQYNTYGSASTSLLGANIFAKQYLPVFNERIGELFVHLQAENYSVIGSALSGQKFSTPIMVGVGRGGRIGPNVSIMYDLNFSAGDNSPHGGAWVVQLGGLYF